MIVPIVVEPGVRGPEYASAGAAGADVRCLHAFALDPGERRLVETGLRMAVPPGFEVQVRPRSGLALRHGIALVNSPGTIDSDYRGEIGVLMINLGAERVEFNEHDRIGQLVLCPVERAEWTTVAELPTSERGAAGFGSTGTV